MKRIVLNLILWTVLVLALLTGWLLVPATFWQYVFFLRVPIVTGLLLFALPLIAKFLLPAMLKNLFVLRGIWQLAFTMLGAIAAGIAVIFVAYTILHNAPARFDLPELSEIPELWLYVLAIALALPTWIATTDLSQEELNNQRWTGFLIGLVSSGCFLVAFEKIRIWLASNDFFNQLYLAFVFLLAKHSTNGYINPITFVTTVEWLNEWLDIKKGLNIKRVLLLQINAFPQSQLNQEIREHQGWFMATIAPLLTLFQVRDPIMASRNLTEVEMLQKQYPKEQVDIRHHSIFFPSQSEAPEFYSQRGQYQPPFSWKLTKKEKEAIKDGWKAIKTKKKIQELKKLWREDWGMSNH